ncbi:MAG: porin family protein [Flavobacterium sp.]|uniref:porin family protein n=1 Tax=Flavobacterium sp. TaxID=239 RepID=UPI0026048B06|nr:porin family protein [Flavobacterium sp.]MDD5149546.1 porin family protein [Flavobacterium sp.]
MKKTILFLVLLFAMSSNTEAQIVKFGIKAGLNYANQTGTQITINSSNYKTDAITSYHAGLVAEIKLIEKFAIQPELLYSTQGATYKNALTEIKNEVGYISIPVLAKIYLNKSISLDLGPQASFLLSGRDKFAVNDSNTYDFSVAAGLGLKITKNIFIQGRYLLGLTEVSKDAQTKNSVVQVSAGILF